MATMSRPMASRSKREGRGHAFPVDSPSFCLKIVTAVDLQDGKELPEPAVRKYGNCMADSIFLKVPNCGTSWPVELKKTIRGSRIWLQKGWEQFTDFYSIDQDYFIVFSYEGEHSHFQVHIFHCNNMEMDYPIRGGGVGGCMSTPNSKGSSFPSASYAGRDQNNDNQHDFYGANNFIFGDKPGFRITMTKSYLSAILRVPSYFTVEHLCEIGSYSDVTLQTSGERTWTVHCAIDKSRRNGRFNAAGWRAFVQDNQLKAGDDCLFQLIGERKLKVYVYRAK
ncbi:B3 domain-containing protein Os03g0212300-like [Rosa rugosa]|uniref:B3 domain-containing protein Os03g0212300-like n=1 Tax=Rosa rugosa TaxID=74645 RepID=UPI002B405CEF|nr:B3 domain-containing protein Os03g0212300-like [Rosa rugosa]